MGLDMYLFEVTYLSNYMGDKQIFEQIKEILNSDAESLTIKQQVAYWRKANQIHGWFVSNVQDGIDDCRDSDVSKEKLEQLLETVDKVLNDHSLADSLLPCRSGFFFGSTNYDDDYFENLEYTKRQLTKTLQKNTDWYIYHASW